MMIVSYGWCEKLKTALGYKSSSDAVDKKQIPLKVVSKSGDTNTLRFLFHFRNSKVYKR